MTRVPKAPFSELLWLSDSWKSGSVTGDRGGLGPVDRFLSLGEYFKLQALVLRLCSAIGATAIGVCSLIYMNAYCSWLLKLHDLPCGVAFVSWASSGDAGRLKYHKEGTFSSLYESDSLRWGNTQIVPGQGTGRKQTSTFPVLATCSPWPRAQGRLCQPLQHWHLGPDSSLLWDCPVP